MNDIKSMHINHDFEMHLNIDKQHWYGFHQHLDLNKTNYMKALDNLSKI